MKDRNTAIFTALMALSMMIWGGSWVSGKAIATALPPETLTFWRFFLTALSTAPALFFIKEPFRIKKDALAYIIAGSALMALYLYCFFKGLEYGLAGASGVLVTTMIPIATFVFSVLLLGHKAAKKDFAGLAMGLAGGAVLLGVWSLDWPRISSGGSLYLLTGAILWSLLTLCSQKAGASASPVVFSTVTSFLSAAVFLPAAGRGVWAVFGLGALFWLNMFYMAVVLSAFATTVYFFASARLSSYRASSFVFIVPASAVVFSWALLGEVPSLSTVAGGLLAIAATYIINM